MSGVNSKHYCHCRAARQGGIRGPRAGSLGADRLGAGAARPPHHRQSRARGSAEGRQPLRSADCAWPDGGDWCDSAGCAFRLHGVGRTRARWIDRAGGGRVAGRDRRQFARRGPDLPRRLRHRSGLGQPRYPDRGGKLADPDRQPFSGHASVVTPAAEGARGRGDLARPARHQGPGKRQARTGNRGGRRWGEKYITSSSGSQPGGQLATTS
jgi:hypothetical protein